MKRKKLIIFGTGGGSNTAFRYFSRDTDREIVAFTQSKEYIKGDSFNDLPLVDFESLEKI